MFVIPEANLLLFLVIPFWFVTPEGNPLLLLVIPEGNLLFLFVILSEAKNPRICLSFPKGIRFLLGKLRHRSEIRAAQRIVCGPAIGLARVANNLPKLRTD